MNSLRIGLMSAALVAGLATASAQTVAADSVMQHVNGKRLSVGGYGEVAMSHWISSLFIVLKVRIRFFQAPGIRQVSVFGDVPRVGDMNCNSWQAWTQTTLPTQVRSIRDQALLPKVKLQQNMVQPSASTTTASRAYASVWADTMVMPSATLTQTTRMEQNLSTKVW